MTSSQNLIKNNYLTEAKDEEALRVIEKLTKDVRKNFPDKLKKVKSVRYPLGSLGVLYYDASTDKVEGYSLGYLVVLVKDDKSDLFKIRTEYVGAFPSRKLYTLNQTEVNLLGRNSLY